ncbi:MAG: hypothetical protein G01um101417_317 [Parcubacteria group bacterium Gr01-1014_17]|nr:MAG: hypothetical protein G01um101417_317 [Parcubacteria group bacterium Gr01-1014_17]
MKTIFIICFHPLISRNILSAPFFKILAGVAGLRIVLVVSEKKIDFFEKFYQKDNVIIEGIPRKLNEADYLFKDLAAAAIRTRTRKLIRNMRLGHERWNALRVFFWAPLIRPLIPKLYAWCMPCKRYATLFEKYKPTEVFATDIFNPMDVIFMYEAKQRGIATVGMVRSWDNLTAKGGFRVVPDTLVVQNEIIKKEAQDIHDIPETKIRVVGIPHYDKYRNGAPMPRTDFCATLGIPPERKFILYAPVGNRFFTKNTFDREMILILRAILPDNFYLLVRTPPGDPVDMEGIPLDPHIIIDEPGTRFPWAGERLIDTEMSPQDDDWLAATLSHCELLVSGFTTLIVDAARFGKPIIVVGFDAKTPLPYNESVLRQLGFNHFQPILKSGGARVARNEKELKLVIDEYLANPEHDAEARQRMVTEQCFRYDGKSSERLLRVILENIKIC